jgi:hypothetical protein
MLIVNRHLITVITVWLLRVFDSVTLPQASNLKQSDLSILNDADWLKHHQVTISTTIQLHIHPPPCPIVSADSLPFTTDF